MKRISLLINPIPLPTSARYSSLSSSLSKTSLTFSFLFDKNLVQLRYKKPNWAILDSFPFFIRFFRYPLVVEKYQSLLWLCPDFADVSSSPLPVA